MSATFARDNSSGLTISFVGHIVLIAVLGMNLIRMPAQEMPQLQLAIEATVIDVAAIRAKEDAERRRVAEIERQKQAAVDQTRRKEEQAQAAQQRKREAADRKAAELKAAERKKVEQKKAEQKKAAEAQRRREEEARVAEQRRKEAAERERQAAEQRRTEAAAAERQAQFASELAAEEQRLAAISSGKQAQYLALIRNRVERNWVRPAGATAGIECDVHVTQIPGGSVVSARIGRCNGDASVKRSIIAAVEKASPLPPPADPSLFDRNLRFTFKPED